MQATLFYQTISKEAIPLTLWSSAQTAHIDALPSHERNALLAQQFKGNTGDVAVLFDAEGKLKQAFMGTGNADNDYQAIAQGVNRLPAALYQPEKKLSDKAMVMWSLAQYRYDQYKKNEVARRQLMVPALALNTVLAESNAIYLVRDLINMPPNVLTPAALAEVVAQLAAEKGAEFKQCVGKALLEENYPAIHAVGRAAAVEPRLISMTWGDPKYPKVTLVGKGVCFDSGGLDIKSSHAMRLMKKDMGGAAQVIGLAQWMMTINLPVHLQVLIPAVENAVGMNAYRPGDILTMRNGVTVEIDNTDAEGRLVLADAMVKACEEKPDLLIDFATLTGAARIAVGTDIAALFSSHDELANEILHASNEVGDPVWRMPLYEGYKNLLDSNVADLANASSSSYAGAITAALFLQRFISAEVPWVHFDIMAWNVSSKPGKPEGGEAMGMQAVGRYLVRRYA